MKVALQDMPESIMKRPEGLVNVRIDPDTGELANANDPDAKFEVFRIENAPKSKTETKQPDIFSQESESSSISDLF